MSGSDDSLVRRYTKLGTEMESLITRANAIPIRYISVDAKGRRVAVASECVLAMSSRKAAELIIALCSVKR